MLDTVDIIRMENRIYCLSITRDRQHTSLSVTILMVRQTGRRFCRQMETMATQKSPESKYSLKGFPNPTA